VWVGLDLPEPALLKLSTVDLDIIHGHSGGPISLLGWQLAKIRDIPFVETYHTMWRDYTHYFPFPHMLALWVAKRVSNVFGNECDALIAPSEKVRKVLLSYGIKKPIHVIPSGIALELFTAQKKGFLKEKLKISQDKKIALFVGRLDKEKSIDFLLESFAKLIINKSDAILVLVGDGTEKERLQKKVQRLGIEKAVYFAGTFLYGEMPKIYSDADIFVFASRSETQGLVIVEALACGLPVLVVKDEVFTDVIKNGVNGFMVERDVTIFGRKLLQILEDEKLLNSLAKNAGDSVTQFSVQSSAKALEQVYMELIAEKASVKGWFWHKLLKSFSHQD
jgi:1,2-diacylglycerol 3-alpha-glucosyltransferase